VDSGHPGQGGAGGGPIFKVSSSERVYNKVGGYYQKGLINKTKTKKEREEEMAKVRNPGVRELQEKAVRYFCDKPGNFPAGRPYNCCESILLTLAEYLGIDSELIPKIGTALGAGVSLNGILCGSISGVAMAIGMKNGRKSPEENPGPAWKMMDEYVDAFRKKFSFVNCRQLTGLNLKTQEGLKIYYARVHDRECAGRLKFAIEKALDILGKNAGQLKEPSAKNIKSRDNTAKK